MHTPAASRSAACRANAALCAERSPPLHALHLACCRAWAASSVKRTMQDLKDARECLKGMVAAGPKGAAKLKADLDAGWGGRSGEDQWRRVRVVPRNRGGA